MFTMIRLAALAALLAAPVTLRYRFEPGKVLRYRTTERAETSVRVGGKSGVVEQQETTGALERRIVSVAGKTAVVEERRLEGQAKVTRPGGVTTRVVEPATFVLTLTTRGECLKYERRVAPGARGPGPQFLEALSFPLPAKALAPGGAWTGETTTTGPDGRPLKVRYDSRYAGDVRRAGHPCARLVTRLRSVIKTAGSGGTGALNGTLTGSVTSCFAKDLGQEAAIEGTLSVTFTARAADGAVQARTTRVTFRQELHTGNNLPS